MTPRLRTSGARLQVAIDEEGGPGRGLAALAALAEVCVYGGHEHEAEQPNFRGHCPGYMK